MSYIGNAPVIQSTEFREEFFPTSNQTAFVTGGFHPSAVSVTRNGVLLSESDYTKGSDNVTITLNSAAISGDVVVIRGNRSLAQGVSVSESRVEYTWQSGDTVVQLNADVIPAYTDVYLNGVKLAAADYRIDANAKTVSFNGAGQTAPAVGDVIAVVHKNETSALVALPLKDSYGNEVLSQSGNAVSIGTLRLPTSGGIQDSSGANVLTEASGTVTLTADEANVGSNALVVDSSGNVGVGTSSLFKRLSVLGTSNEYAIAVQASAINLNKGYVITGPTGTAEAIWTSDAATGEVRFGGLPANYYITCYTSGAERMRIDSSGYVRINNTTGLDGQLAVLTGDWYAGAFANANNSYPTIYTWNKATSGDNRFINFYTETSASQKGSIDYNRAAGQTRYNQTSDANLKNIICDSNLLKSVEILNSTRIREFAWKDDESQKPQIGVIAQELYETYKGAVSVGGDVERTDDEGNVYTEYQPWSVDKTAFTFHLVAGWQRHEKIIKEQQALIESQQSQIDALTARIEALEATP